MEIILGQEKYLKLLLFNVLHMLTVMRDQKDEYKDLLIRQQNASNRPRKLTKWHCVDDA